MRFVVVAAIVVSAMFASPGSVAAQEAEGAQPKQARPRPAPSERSEPSDKPREVSQAERRRPPSASAAETRSNDDQDQAAPSAQRPGAVRRPPPSSPSGSGSSGGTSSGSSASEGAVPASSRTPDHVDRAVPRHSPAYPPRRDYYDPHYHYYDPWGYGTFSLGYFYFSPWGYGPGYWGPGPWGPGYYGYGPYVPYGYDLGMVKLKVRPRDAEVYVDGYYAGTVDDFDGVFQALKLDSGGHKIEIRKPGFATLQFDVLVQPERSITYRGEMKPIP
jgi:hypothetical protein